MSLKLKRTFAYTCILFLGLSLSACSNISGDGASNKNQKPVIHTHEANKCIDEISHSHPNGDKKHLHYYHYCEPKSSKSNAHSHPSKSSITGFFRHVHPNGSNEHSH